MGAALQNPGNVDETVRWFVEHAPRWAAGLALPLLVRLATFPAVRIEFIGGDVLWDRGEGYRRYRAKVVNKGSTVARGCWPQLLRISSLPDVTAQAMPWEFGFEYSTQYVEYRDISPRDETNEIPIAFTSQRESGDGTGAANIPIARQESRVPTLFVLEPGEHIVTITVVGENFACRPVKFRARLTDAGKDTWQTLRVEEWHWHAGIRSAVAKWIGRRRHAC